MRDPDFPAFLFNTCPACGKDIKDPELGGAVGLLPKGGGFTSTRLFCSEDCAAGSEVLAALEHTDENGNPTSEDDEDDYWGLDDEDEDEDEDEDDDAADEADEAESA